MERLVRLVQVRSQDEEGQILLLRGRLIDMRVPEARLRLSLAGQRRRRLRRSSPGSDQLHAARRLDGVVRVVGVLQVLRRRRETQVSHTVRQVAHIDG